MKKIVLTLMGIALIATTALIYSCSKEANQKEANEGTPALKAKGYDPKLLAEDMETFWEHCNKAYYTHGDKFIDACLKNNEKEFLDMTGAPSDLVDEIAYQSKLMYEEFLEKNPDYKPVECESCAEDALPEFGMDMKYHFQLLDEIRKYDATLGETHLINQPPITIDTCELRCRSIVNYHPEFRYYIRFIACLAKCQLSDIINKNTETLDGLKKYDWVIHIDD